MTHAGRWAVAVLFLVTAAGAAAEDRWEARGDDGPGTSNELKHGVVQGPHDLQGTAVNPDQDWFYVHTKRGHSYEARVFGGGVPWAYPECPSPNCSRFDRVDTPGAVLTAGMIADGAAGRSLAVRWIVAAGGSGGWDLLRAVGTFQNSDLGPEYTYDIQFLDTTLFLSRFNNTGSQVTVLILQNTRDYPVSGNVQFYTASGSLLHTQQITLPAAGSLVLNTAGLGPLAGQAGSAKVAQDGGYAALTGKAVGLDASTGFSFDTPLTPVPY